MSSIETKLKTEKVESIVVSWQEYTHSFSLKMLVYKPDTIQVVGLANA